MCSMFTSQAWYNMIKYKVVYKSVITLLPTKPNGNSGLHSVHLSVSLSVGPQYQFSRLFSKTLADIDHDLLIKFEFRYAISTFHEITGLGLVNFTNLSFTDFFS